MNKCSNTWMLINVYDYSKKSCYQRQQSVLELKYIQNIKQGVLLHVVWVSNLLYIFWFVRYESTYLLPTTKLKPFP